MQIAQYDGHTNKQWNKVALVNDQEYSNQLQLYRRFDSTENLSRKSSHEEKENYNGEYDQNLIKDDHEPIISKEIFHKAQRIRKQKLNKMNSKPVFRKYPFSGMLKCGVCGRGYSHKSTPHNDIWKCSYALKRGKEACHSKQVPTEILIDASNHILRKQEFDEEYFKSKVDFILVMPNRKLVFQMNDGTSEEYFWVEKSRSESWTPEMREQARIKELNRLKGVIDNG